MHAELLVLRLIHILGGIFWIGSGLYAGFFLGPALASTPAVMGQVMAALQKRRAFRAQEIAAFLVLLSGLRLLMIDSAGFSGSYFATGTGRTFAIAGVFAILAGIFNFGVARPTMERAVAVGAALAAAADTGEKARLSQELDRLRKRGAIAGLLAVTSGILAASGMAVARYV
jgi:uncharacterized membrane protein